MTRITRLSNGHDLPLPTYATNGSAGMDLYAAVDEEIVVHPGKRVLVPCGIAIALDHGFEAQIRARSGLALKNGITLMNGVGTLDEDYRGQVGVILYNSSEIPFPVKRGDRIAQMVIAPVTQVVWQEVESLDETDRGAGGFGSTGVS